MKKLLIKSLIAVAFIFSIVSCNKTKDEPTATNIYSIELENYDEVSSAIDELEIILHSNVTENNLSLGRFPFNSQKIEFPTPTSIPDDIFSLFKTGFNMDISKMQFSNEAMKNAFVVINFYKDRKELDATLNGFTRAKNTMVMTNMMYADRDCDVTGEAQDDYGFSYTYDMHIKNGYNVVYTIIDENTYNARIQTEFSEPISWQVSLH